MSVTRRLRFEILRRDNFRCRYCGTVAAETELNIDHVIPVALGGSDDPSNLVVACVDCNGGKTSIAPDSAVVADVSADALRWKDAMQQAAEEREVEYASKKATLDQFRKLWEAWTAGGRVVDLPADFGNSVNNLLTAGLTFSDFEELIDVAMTMKTVKFEAKWKYFCGCCWKRAKQANERAQQIAGANSKELIEVDESWSPEFLDAEWNFQRERWSEAAGSALPACECLKMDFCGTPACRASLIERVRGALGGEQYRDRTISILAYHNGHWNTQSDETASITAFLEHEEIVRIRLNVWMYRDQNPNWEAEQDERQRAEEGAHWQALEDERYRQHLQEQEEAAEVTRFEAEEAERYEQSCAQGGDEMTAPEWAARREIENSGEHVWDTDRTLEWHEAEKALLMPRLEKLFWQFAQTPGPITRSGAAILMHAITIHVPLSAAQRIEQQDDIAELADAAAQGGFDFAYIARLLLGKIDPRTSDALPPFVKRYAESTIGAI